MTQLWAIPLLSENSGATLLVLPLDRPKQLSISIVLCDGFSMTLLAPEYYSEENHGTLVWEIIAKGLQFGMLSGWLAGNRLRVNEYEQ